MFIDGNWIFSNVQAITASAASTNAIDLTGAGSGNKPNLTFGNATSFAEDLGIGDGMAIPKILINITATFLTLTSLNIQFQGAPDSGSNTAGTYTTYDETGAIPAAGLLLGRVIPLSFGSVMVAASMPRFVRLNYVVAGSSATAGSLFAGLVLQQDTPPQSAVGQYPSGFSVGA